MSSNSSHLMNGPRPRASSPHFPDRRQSYAGPSSRPNDNSYRPDEFSNRDVMREPPKGPKAHFENPRGSFVPRGRGGYFSRDRDPRDARDGPFHRRDGERDWSRKDNPDNRDRRTSPSNLDRSRSPNANPFRDTRDQVPRETDSSRYGVGSRDSFAPVPSSIPDGPQSTAPFGRGSYRGRGRGDYPFRGRGRGFEERERFTPRSRSRERAWNRDFRDDRARDRDRDWDTERRETEDRRHKDEIDHDSDRRREIGTFRSASRNSNGSLHQPLTPNSGHLPATNSTQTGLDRPTFRSASSQDELVRPRHVNSSVADVTTSVPNHPQTTQSHQSLQNQGTQNHALNVQNHSLGTPHQARSASETTQVDESQATKPDPTIAAPKGPKASRQLSPQPPVGRRADLHERPSPQTGQESSSSRYDANQGVRGAPQAPSSGISSPPTSRFGGGQRPPISNRFSQTPFSHPLHPPRLNDQRQTLQPSSRLTYGESPNFPGQSQSRQSSQQETADSSGKTPTKSLGSSSHQTSPVATVPLGPKYNPGPVSIRQTSIAPVRPRGPASIAGANGLYSSHKIWINPKLLPAHQPSILQTVPPTANHSTPQKRDHTGELKSSPNNEKHPTAYTNSTSPSTLNDVTQSSNKSPTPTPGTSDDPKLGSLFRPQNSAGAKKDESAPSSILEGESATVPDHLDRPKTGDNHSDDEDGMDLDEDYLAKNNEAYEKDLRELEARRPPTPRHNKELLALLEEIDVLASAAEDLASGVYVARSTVERKTYEKTEIGLLSPEPEISEPHPTGATLHSDPYFGIPPDDDSSSDSASLINLPYYQACPPTPFSEIVSRQDSFFQHTRSSMVERIKAEKSDLHRAHDRLRTDYRQIYKTWRIKNEELDRQNKALNDSTLPDTSPTPVESPMVLSTTVYESRGRVPRFASEFDFQRVIQETKIQAEMAESRERQLLEDQALADMAKEAKIPDMLSSKDAAASKFRDTNRIIKPEAVLEVFSFVQSEDDFTAEEHKVFTEEYLQNPKKWGKIAEAIPGRDYQDCVLHYYLTKKEANYKGQLAKKMSKKGTRKPRQTVQKGPRSNALMSNMGGRNQMLNNAEADLPQAPVTDTGRPRRAAAPTFEKSVAEAEQANGNPSLNRRGPNQNKSDANGNMTPEKSAAKRPRVAQPKEKGTKKKNAQLLAAAPAPGPVPIKEADPHGLKVKEMKVEDGPRMPTKIEDAQLLAHLAGPPMMTGPPQYSSFGEPWSASVRAPDKMTIVEKPPQQQQPQQPQQQPQSIQYAQVPEKQSQPVQQQQPPPPPSRNAGQTSSYWSVPEQTDFPRLLEMHGTDWQQIANKLKNKTAVMVKNYYHRSTENGKNESFESIAREADDRIKHRPKLSNPPQPGSIPKQRFEPSPQAAATHRILAPNTEVAEQGAESNQGPANAFTQLSPNHVAQTPPHIAPMPLPSTSNGPTLAQAAPLKMSGTAATNQKSSHSSRGHRHSQVAIAANIDGTREPRPIIQAQSLATRQSEPQAEQSRVMVPQQQQQVPLQSPQKSQHQGRPTQHLHRPSIDQHGFTEATRLARERFEPQHQQMVLCGHLPPSTPPHNVIALPSFASDNRQGGQMMSDRVQAPLGLAREPEKVSKPNRPPIMPDSSPPSLQRRDSVGPSSHTPTLFPVPPPPLARANIMSPPQERPSSVPVNPPLQQPPPPRSNPAPAKRSNIMSILNDDPPEPQPRRVLPESQPVTPAPPTGSTIPPPPYQQQPHQAQMSYPKQEQAIDSHRLIQHQQPPPSHQQRFASKVPQQIRPQEQQIEQVIQMREQPPTSWPPSGPRSGFDQRLPFTSQQTHLYDQALPLSVMQQQIMSTRPTSPPMLSSSANQRESFASLQSHPHGSRPQPASNLGPAPSPYSQPGHHSKLQPHPQQAQPPPPRAQPLYSLSPHQDPMSRQHQETFQRHRDDPRAHDAMRQQDFGRQEGYQHQLMMREQEMRVEQARQQHILAQESLRQQEDRRQLDVQRQQEAMRQNDLQQQQQHELRQRDHLRNQEAAMRHKEQMRPQQLGQPHQQSGLGYRDPMRPQDFVRNEHSNRNYTNTPPGFHGHGGYGPPPPPPQHPQHGQHPPPPPLGQSQQGRSGYEDLR